MGWSTWDEHRKQEWEDTKEAMFRDGVYPSAYIELARKYVGDAEIERFQCQMAAMHPGLSGPIESHMESRDDGIARWSEAEEHLRGWGVA